MTNLLLATVLLAQDSAFESYRAHLAAAQASLERGDVSQTLAWLDGAPSKYRGWEWSYIRSQCDHSQRSVQLPGGAATKVQSSPDGKTLAVASADGVVRLLDSQSFQVTKSLNGHKGAVFGLEFSADGKFLVTTSRDNTIRLWDVAGQKEIGVLGEHPVTPYNAKFTPDGKRVVSVGWRMNPEQKSPVGLVRVWDVATKAMLHTADITTHPISSLDFSSDGSRCYIGCWEYQVLDLNMVTYKVDREIAPPADAGYKAVDWVDVSPDGTRLVTATKDRSVFVYSLPDGKLVHDLDHFGQATSARFSPDGSRIVSTCADGSVRIWDAGKGTLLAKLHGHLTPVYCGALSPDGSVVYSVDRDGIMRSWIADPFRHNPEIQVEGAWSSVPDPSNTLLAVGGNDRFVSIYRLSDGSLVKQIGPFGSLVVDAAWSPDGGRVAAGSNDGSFRVFDVKSGAEVWKVQDKGQMRSAAWSRDGKWVASGSGTTGVAKVWHADDGRELLAVPMAPGTVNAAFSADSKKIVFAAGNTLISAPLLTKEARRTASLASSGFDVATSSDGRLIAVGEENGIVEVFRADDLSKVWATKTSGSQWGVDFSPDGNRLASIGYDFTMHLFDTKFGGEVMAIRNLPTQGFDVRFSPDGRTLAYMGGSGWLRWISARTK